MFRFDVVVFFLGTAMIYSFNLNNCEFAYFQIVTRRSLRVLTIPTCGFSQPSEH